jgi:sugar phosphate isomerase/epimerase
MKLGIGSYTFPWAVGVPGHLPDEPLSAIGLLERAREFGVRVVQFADNLPLDRLADAELEAVIARAAEWQLAIEVGTRGVAVGHLRRQLALAKRVGSTLLRTIPEAPGKDLPFDEILSNLQMVVPDLAAAKVRLALENHGRISVKDLRQLVEALQTPWVGICLDTVNSLGMAEGSEVVIGELARHTVNLHVKDFVVRRLSHQMGYMVEGAPAGKGQLDVPRLLNTLRSAGVSPNAILELWTPLQENLQRTIALEQAWAVESIEFLRRHIPE